MEKTNYLRYLDTIGYTVSFTHNSDRKFKTRFGGCMSLLIIVAYFTLFYFLGSDDFYKENPHSFYQLDPLDKDFHLNFTTNPLLAGVAVNGLETNIDGINNLFKPIFTYERFERSGGGRKITKKLLKTIRCDKIILPKSYDISIFNLSKFLCPDLSALNEQENMEGNYNSESLRYLRLRISNCDFEGKNCADIKKNYQLFKNYLVVSLIYPEVFYDKNNYKEPLKTKLNGRLKYLNPKSFDFEQLVFTDNVVKDHETKNLFFFPETINNQIGAKHLNYIVTIRDSDYDEIIPRTDEVIYYDLNLLLDLKQHSYYRKYKTVIQVVTEVNSITLVIYNILIFVVNYIGKFIFMRYLFTRTVIDKYNNDEDIGRKNTIFLKNNLLSSENKKKVDKINENYDKLKTIKTELKSSNEEKKVENLDNIPESNTQFKRPFTENLNNGK